MWKYVKNMKKYVENMKSRNQRSEAHSEARCESSYITFFLYKSPGTWKNSDLSPCRFWNFTTCIGCGTQKSEASSEVRCESSYIPFSPHKDPGTWKNSKLSLHKGSGPLYSVCYLKKSRASLIQALEPRTAK